MVTDPNGACVKGISLVNESLATEPISLVNIPGFSVLFRGHLPGAGFKPEPFVTGPIICCHWNTRNFRPLTRRKLNSIAKATPVIATRIQIRPGESYNFV